MKFLNNWNFIFIFFINFFFQNWNGLCQFYQWKLEMWNISKSERWKAEIFDFWQFIKKFILKIIRFFFFFNFLDSSYNLACSLIFVIYIYIFTYIYIYISVSNTHQCWYNTCPSVLDTACMSIFVVMGRPLCRMLVYPGEYTNSRAPSPVWGEVLRQPVEWWMDSMS